MKGTAERRVDMLEIFSQPIRPVWLASFPRSGNTFLRIILEKFFRCPTYSLYRVEDQKFPDPSAEALEDAPYLPRKWWRLVSDDPEARLTLIKTHDLPQDDRPAIYIARDGRAALESYYHYHQKFAFEQPSRTEIIAGGCQFGSWSGHYEGWDPQTRPQTLFLKYEDMVAQPQEVISKLAGFLKIKPCDGRLPTFDELKQKSPAFFRRGQNHDACSEWSSGQVALFNALHGKIMRELGYELAPVGEIPSSIATDLAESLARIHKLYLRELQNSGLSAEARKELSSEVIQLSQRVSRLSAQLEDGPGQPSHPLVRNPWVKVGMALGLVPRAPTHPEP